MNKYQYFLVYAKIGYVQDEGTNYQMWESNFATRYDRTEKINQKAIESMKQMAVSLFSKNVEQMRLDPKSIRVYAPVIANIIYLGTMTEEEYNAK